MIKLNKEDITVFPAEWRELGSDRKPIIYYTFNGNEKIKTRKFNSVDKPTCGFYKCAYISNGEKKIAYVSYNGDYYSEDAMVNHINVYMDNCRRIKEAAERDGDSFDSCYSRLEREADLLESLLEMDTKNIESQRKISDI